MASAGGTVYQRSWSHWSCCYKFTITINIFVVADLVEVVVAGPQPPIFNAKCVIRLVILLLTVGISLTITFNLWLVEAVTCSISGMVLLPKPLLMCGQDLSLHQHLLHPSQILPVLLLQTPYLQPQDYLVLPIPVPYYWSRVNVAISRGEIGSCEIGSQWTSFHQCSSCLKSCAELANTACSCRPVYVVCWFYLLIKWKPCI